MSLVRKFSLASVLVLGLGAVAGERLYNGIELPEVWPPELDRLRTKPMPVPYLEASGIPETILIDIGRQLFVDVEGGAYNNGAMGLAKLRRDGFAALVADREGFVTTRPVRYSGRELFVNLDAPAGRLKVELLEADVDRVLATLPTVSGNGTKIRVGSVAEFAGRRMRFRFTLEKASLYAFWVSATADGASGGYLAGGGPGYDGLRDVRSGE